MTELHVRLDGSMRPKTCVTLYRHQARDLPYTQLANIDTSLTLDREAENNTEMSIKALQFENAIERVTFETLTDLEEKGITYAELCYAPVLSTKCGLTQNQVVDTIISGMARYQLTSKNPMKVGLVLSFLRGADEKENLETLEVARQFVGTPVCGIDLVGDAKEYPFPLYQDLLQQVKEFGYPIEIDLEGETKENIKAALSLNPERILNAEAIIDDDSLVEEVKQKGILAEFSLSGKYRNGNIELLVEHPLKKFLEKGIRTCLVSDCSTYYNTDLMNENFMARNYLDVTYEQCMIMERFAQGGTFLKK